MTEQTGAAAPAAEPAVIAPAESQTATPEVRDLDQVVTPEKAETETPAETPEGDQPEGEESEPRKLSRYQRLQRQKARLANVIAEQAAELETFRKGAKPADDLPKPTDYAQGEYDPGYLSDLAAAKAAKKIDERLEQRDQKSVQERIAEQRNEAAEDFLERADELKAKITDYDAAIASFAQNGGKFAPHVIEELYESENGPLLAYQLAKNPQKVAEINGMSARDAAREIGRLEAKASLPQPKKQTQAPAPLAPVSGGASPGVSLETASMADYVRLRKADKD